MHHLWIFLTIAPIEKIEHIFLKFFAVLFDGFPGLGKGQVTHNTLASPQHT